MVMCNRCGGLPHATLVDITDPAAATARGDAAVGIARRLLKESDPALSHVRRPAHPSSSHPHTQACHTRTPAAPAEGVGTGAVARRKTRAPKLVTPAHPSLSHPHTQACHTRTPVAPAEGDGPGAVARKKTRAPKLVTPAHPSSSHPHTQARHTRAPKLVI
eukprot:4512257-Pyramimonas_sp.AAC.1